MRTRILVILLILALMAGCDRNRVTEQMADALPITNQVVEESEKTTKEPTNVSHPPTKTPEPEPIVVFEPRFQEAHCPFVIPDGRDPKCGYVTVPQDHNEPENGRTIRLPVAIFSSQREDPPADPIVYFSGGPGGDLLEALQYNFNVAFAPYAADRDLVLFDQRGTGFSEPSLACPEYGEMVLQHLEEDLPLEETVSFAMEAIFTCHERLMAEGVDFTVYNSAQNAADVDMLRQALDIEKWNLYGASYGSRLAQTVMRDHPEGVRSVVLDSTYPPASNLQLDTPDNVKRAMDLFFATCEADIDCHAAYPDLENTFWQLVSDLNADPIVVTLTHAFTGEKYNVFVRGDNLLAQLFQSLYNSELTSLFPQLIYATRDGDTSLLGAFMASSLVKAEFVSLGMMFSVLCHDEVSFSDPEEVAAAVATYPELERLFTNSIATGLMALPVCERWQAGKPDPIENEPITSDIPTLIIHGQHDPVTPPSWGRWVGEGLSRHYFFEFPGVGHGAGLGQECPSSIVRAFQIDPLIEPQADCMAEMAFTFVTPADSGEIRLVNITLGEFGMRALMPADWLEVSPEYRVSPDRTVEFVVKLETDATSEETFNRWHTSEIIQELTINGLNWSIREIAFETDSGEAIAGYLATAPAEEGFYMLLLVTSPEQQLAMHDAIFLPSLKSVKVEDGFDQTGDGDDTAIVLVSFNNDQFGIKGLAPDGWLEHSLGVYNQAGVATLVQQAAVGMDVEGMMSLLIGQLGLEKFPDAVGEYESSSFTWTLYALELDSPAAGPVRVDIALTSTETATYIILLQAVADEFDNLHAGAFLPALDTFSLQD